LLGAAPGLYGLIFNYLPYRITGPLAKALSSDPTKTHYFQLWIGTLAFAVYYAVAMLLLWLWWRPGRVVMWVLLASWPIFGLFARIYASALVRERRLLHLAILSATHGAALQQVRRMRQRLVAEMDALLQHYLSSRRGQDELDTAR
jgi:hypothetical protein